jgi:hypothetical protein
MDKITQMVREIFKDNITINDTIVKVLPTYTLTDSTPCITIINQGGRRYPEGEKLLNLYLPLPSTHPLYDKSNPLKTYPQQVRRSKNNTTIQVNVWATTEQERYNINEQVNDLLWKLQSDYYKFCTNYTDGECSTLKTNCPATTINNHHTIKGQCPKPDDYNFTSLFMKYNIIRSSFDIEPEFNQDEYDTSQTIYRTIFKLNMDYYNYYILGGNPTTNINII